MAAGGLQPEAAMLPPGTVLTARASQIAAMLPAGAMTEGGGDALLVSDLAAAQALAEGCIESAGAAARSETLSRSLDQMRDSVKAAEEMEHCIVGSSAAASRSAM